MRRNTASVILAVLFFTLLTACSKSSADSCSSEASLAVTTTPANGSTETPSAGPFLLKVSITSALPSAGVTIEVKAHKESDTNNYFTQTSSSSTKDNNFEIANTPSTVTCVVDITVTSKSCSSNKWTGSYRYSKK